eukprot:TRINITY_DN3403_c0_g1_i1.p1 TRINITY_DN3403_c0_g1~~TRINITY_DN3403_c0_g1_i1.p1  ORF type:complete len:401 (+),score=67.85 TRINITY_DN3403_c0_g1_i1:205-1407(+)
MEAAAAATLYGALGGALGGMTAVSVMIAAQLGYYKRKSNDAVRVLSTATTTGMRVSLVPLGSRDGEKQDGVITGISRHSIMVQFDDESIGLQDVPRDYWDGPLSDATRAKGQAWYEIKKAYVTAKCCKYEAQACCCGTALGICMAEGDEVLMAGGVHPAAVLPDAFCAGAMCMVCCHCARLGYKACKHAGKKKKEQQNHEEAQRTREALGIRPLPNDQPDVQGIPLDEHGFPVVAKPAVAEPVRGTRGFGDAATASQISRGSRGVRGAGGDQRSSAAASRMEEVSDYYWEEKQRRQQIQQMFEAGGDPADGRYRHLYQRPPPQMESEAAAAPTRGRRGVQSAVSTADSTDLHSLPPSQVSRGSGMMSSGDESLSRASPVRRPMARPTGNTRLGVSANAAW